MWRKKNRPPAAERIGTQKLNSDSILKLKNLKRIIFAPPAEERKWLLVALNGLACSWPNYDVLTVAIAGILLE